MRELTELADKVAKVQLERRPGVGEVRIVGGQERAISVWVDADRLAAYGIPVTAVRDALVRQNADMPGGNVTTDVQERVLRTMGRVADAGRLRQHRHHQPRRRAAPRSATSVVSRTAPRSSAASRGSTASRR